MKPFPKLWLGQSRRHFIEALLQALFGHIERLIRLVAVFRDGHFRLAAHVFAGSVPLAVLIREFFMRP
jgi:hypothetical protein